MSYSVDCDLCPNTQGVNSNGQIPAEWGSIVVEKFNKNMDPAVEQVDDIVRGKTITLHICPVCNDKIDMLGMAAVEDAFSEALRILISEPEGEAPVA